MRGRGPIVPIAAGYRQGDRAKSVIQGPPVLCWPPKTTLEDPLEAPPMQKPPRVRGFLQTFRVEGRLAVLSACLLGIHILWGALRIPGKVYGKRLEHVRRYREVGAPGYHLDTDHRQGADLLRLLLAETPPDCILLWRGDTHGAIEFVPPLIAPRLLVAENECPANATHLLERPLAQGMLADGSRGVFVLVGHGDSLSLELR